MGAHHRHAHAGAAHLQIGQVHDLAALVLHLHLLGGVAVVQLAADHGDDVGENLAGEGAALNRLALGLGDDLALQLAHALHARAGHRLIGAGDHLLDLGDLADAAQGHQRDDGGAVRVGDDALVELRVIGVDLRHHQRNLRIHAEGGGIVHEHRAGLHDCRGEVLGLGVLHRAQHEVHALEGVFGGLLNGDLLTAEGDGLAGAACAGEGEQGSHGEVALLQNADHLLSNCAGGAENCHIVGLHASFPPSLFIKPS